MIRSSWVTTLSMVLGLAGAPLVHGESSNDAMTQLTKIMADDTLRQASYDAGHERIRFCGHCHGVDGNSKRDYIPNLASQHPLYLFDQFEKFGDGRREDYVMSRLAETLSMEERINIAVYYSEQVAKPREGSEPGLKAAGKKLFETRCTTCHGKTAEGFQNMPRLAGQPSEYIGLALKRFQEMDPQTGTSPMIGIAGMLSEQQVRELGAYLQGL